MSVILWLVALVSSALLLPILSIDGWISWQARDRVYHQPQQMPAHYDMALVLGTNKFMPSGQLNRFYIERIQAAADLYHLNLVSGILVSGDNRFRSYNEPRQMRQDLIAQGVPAPFITLDFAGFRTLDSVVRAQQVFGQQRLVIVTQPFHLDRALFLARMNGMDAIGYAADSPSWRGAPKVRLRDVLARVLAVMDVLQGVEPHFLGEPVDVIKRQGPLSVSPV